MYRNRPYTDDAGNLAYSCELIGAKTPLEILPGDLVEAAPRVATHTPTLAEKLDALPVQTRLLAALVRFAYAKQTNTQVPGWALTLLNQAEQFIESQGG